jgi:hypothetical protein
MNPAGALAALVRPYGARLYEAQCGGGGEGSRRTRTSKTH